MLGGVRIKDNVHGYIYVPRELKSAITANPLLERLRYIHHMGAGFFIYVSAHQSRYEHSLGVYHVASKLFNVIANKVNIDRDEYPYFYKLISLAALFHDIGHVYFSHTTEDLIYEFGANESKVTKAVKERIGIHGKPHERMACYILSTNNLIQEKIKRILPEQDLDAVITDICRIIVGLDSLKTTRKKWLAKLINGTIDADRLDYILRDSVATGFARALDLERIVDSVTIYKDEIVFERQALSILRYLLNLRDDLYLWVYKHHKVTYVDEIVRRLTYRLITRVEKGKITSREASNVLDIEYIFNNYYGDYILIYMFHKYLKDDKLFKMLIQRDYHKSCWKSKYEMQVYHPKSTIQRIINYFAHLTRREYRKTRLVNSVEELEESVANKLGYHKDDFILAYTKFTRSNPVDADRVKILFNDEDLFTMTQLGIHNPVIRGLESIFYLYVIRNYRREGKVREILNTLAKYVS